MIQHESQRPGAFQQRAHHPQVRATAWRIGVAIWNQIPGRDGDEKEAVQISVDWRLGNRNLEEAGEQRPSREHHDADNRVVDSGDGRNDANRAQLGSFFNSPLYVVVRLASIRTSNASDSYPGARTSIR